jgi:hypothetical protein
MDILASTRLSVNVVRGSVGLEEGLLYIYIQRKEGELINPTVWIYHHWSFSMIFGHRRGVTRLPAVERLGYFETCTFLYALEESQPHSSLKNF